MDTKKEFGLNKALLGINTPSKPAPLEPWQTLTTADRSMLLAAKQGVFLKNGKEWQQTLKITTKVLTEQNGTVYAATRDGLHRSTDNGKTWQRLFEGDIRQLLKTGTKELLAVSTTALWSLNTEDESRQQMLAFEKPLDVRSIALQDNRINITAKEGLFQVSGNRLQKEKLPKAAGQEPMDLQKLITDLHNGKLGGWWLIAAIDLTALALIFLTVSGLWIWWVPRRARRAKMGS